MIYIHTYNEKETLYRYITKTELIFIVLHAMGIILVGKEGDG